MSQSTDFNPFSEDSNYLRRFYHSLNIYILFYILPNIRQNMGDPPTYAQFSW